MKRLMALLMSLLLVLALTACGEEPADTTTTTTADTTTTVITTTTAAETVTTTSKLGPYTTLKPTTTTTATAAATTTTTVPETDPLEDLFAGYLWLCYEAGPFASTADLSPRDFLWSLDGGGTICGVDLPSETEDKGVNEWGVDWLICTIKVSDLNTFTTKLLGRTYDYTNVELTHGLRGTCTYDAASDSIVYDSGTGGAGGGGSYPVFVDYTTTDKVNYTLTYEEEDWNDDDPVKKGTIRLKLVNGVYQIVSHTLG